MCYSVGLDIDTTDFAHVPSPPFTEPALPPFPVVPSTMSLCFPVAVLSPSMGDGGGRQSSASGATPHLRETSCAWLLSTLQTPQPSSHHAAEVPLLSPLFWFCCFRIKIHSVVQLQSAPSLISAL